MKKWLIAATAAAWLTGCGGGSSTDSSGSTSRFPIPILSKTIAAGQDFTLVRDDNGSVSGSGNNGKNQLGHATTYSVVWSAENIPALSKITVLDAGSYHALTLSIDGKVYAFGENDLGELGLGDTAAHSAPKPIPNLPNIVDIAAGAKFSLVLDADGHVWSFGDNRYGQLGQGGTDRDAHSTPVKLTMSTGIKAVFARGFKAMMIDDNGSVYGLGYNGWNSMGSGNFRENPAKLSGLSSIQSVAIGASHALYLDKDGNVYAAGRSTHGQLGIASAGSDTYDRLGIPTKIDTLPKAAMIAAGANFSMVLDRDGNVWAFGDNGAGQLGTGDTAAVRTPVKIPGLTHIIAIAASGSSAFALDKEGNVYSWGYGGYGSLGLGNSNDHTRPQRISGIKGVSHP